MDVDKYSCKIVFKRAINTPPCPWTPNNYLKGMSTLQFMNLYRLIHSQ